MYECPLFSRGADSRNFSYHLLRLQGKNTNAPNKEFHTHASILTWHAQLMLINVGVTPVRWLRCGVVCPGRSSLSSTSVSKEKGKLLVEPTKPAAMTQVICSVGWRRLRAATPRTWLKLTVAAGVSGAAGHTRTTVYHAYRELRHEASSNANFACCTEARREAPFLTLYIENNTQVKLIAIRYWDEVAYCR